MTAVTEKTYETLLVEQQERVGVVRLNRPQALNALNPQLIEELVNVLRGFDTDPNIGCIVITGSEKAFAAGADISDMATWSAAEAIKNDPISHWDAIASIQTPIIAAISGYALGGGLEIAMMCDIIIASESAKFGQPEIKIGVIPGAGGTQRLTRAIGKSRAMQLILTGRNFGAQEALNWGLVAQVVTDRELQDTALTLAKTISQQPALAVQAAKRMVNQAFERPLTDGLTSERHTFYQLFDTADQKEGMTAFLEKRPAAFTHQ